MVYLIVDGGHRAIIFSRIGGIQDNIYTEGLHFRYGTRAQSLNLSLGALVLPEVNF